MKILVINAGSSSLKYQLIDTDGDKLLAKGICEQIGDANSSFTHKVPDDLILYAAELSANSRFPLQFINKQLAKWHDAHITTLEQAKKSAIAVENPKSSAKNFTEREYTKEQLDSIFKNVPDIEEYDI